MKMPFRRIRLILLTFILALSVAACGSEEKVSGGDGGSEKITIGTDTSFVPFEFLNQDSGEYEGFDIDLVKAIAEKIGIEYELKPMDFNGLIPALQTGNLDMAIAGMTITDERKKVVDFTRPYYDAGLYILVRSDENSIKGVEDLKGKVVATKQGTTSFNYASKLDGLKEVRPFPNIDQAYMELEKGSADAVIYDSPNVLYYIKTKGKGKVKTVGDLLQAESYGIAFPKGSPLRDKVDDALGELMEDGTYEKLYVKWFGQKPPKKE